MAEALPAQRAAHPIGAADPIGAEDLLEADEVIEGGDLVEPDDLLDPGHPLGLAEGIGAGNRIESADLLESPRSEKVARDGKGDRSQSSPGAPTPPAGAPYGSRREARERALSLLYEADAKAITPAALLDEIPVQPPPYVTSLVAGVGTSQAQIDELIARYAIDWTVDRMPVIDRMVVRIATFELLGRPDVPTGVVISEAVELAKRYSTDESGRFVNGVLASIAAEIRPTA